MASDRTAFINTLNSKISNLEQFNRTDNRFKFNIEYIKESSDTVNSDNDLIIESSNNNIKFLVDTTKNVEFFGDSKFNNNMEVHGLTTVENINVNGNLILSNNVNLSSNALFKGDVTFESNIDVSGSLTVNGVDTYSKTLAIEQSLLEYLPLTYGVSGELTIYEIILDICNNPVLSNIDSNLFISSDNSVGVSKTSAIKNYIKTGTEIPNYYDVTFFKKDTYKKYTFINNNNRVKLNNINIINIYPLYHMYTFGNTSQISVMEDYSYANNNSHSTNDNLWIAGGVGSSSTLAISNDFNIWKGINNLLLEQAIYKIHFNGRIWVAVGIGINETIIYSFNGLIWYGANVEFDNSKWLFSVRGYDVTYDNRLWVAVGTNLTYGMIGYSHDGINWTPSTTINNSSIQTLFSIQALGVKWCGERWIAIGEGTNSIAYSYDGIKWTGLGNTMITKAEAIHFNGYRVVIVGSAGTYNIVYSDDYGLTWNGVNNKPTLFNNILNVNYNGNLWLACGSITNDVSSGIIYSYNALKWLPLDNESIIDTSNNYFNNIEWDGDNWLLLSKLITSNNGNTIKYNNSALIDNWNNNTTLSSIINTSLHSLEKNIKREHHIISQSSLMYMCGNSSNYSLAYSYNGINWFEITNTIFTTCNCIAFNGEKYVAVGSGTNTIAVSRDGLQWFGIGSILFTTQGNHVIWNNNMFIATGEGTNTLLYSYDGINWNTTNNIFTTKGNTAIYFKNRWFAGGSGSASLAYSDDGIIWTGLGSALFNTEILSFATNGSVIVAVGSSNNSLAYSYNGINWSTVAASTLLLPIVRDIYWNSAHDMWVAVGNGNNNRIIYSYDIVSWFVVSNGNSLFSTNANSVIWNGYIWVACGEGTNNYAYSYDGVNWQTGSLFSNFGFKVIHINKPWIDLQYPIVTVGNGVHSITYSNDGFNWKGLGTTLFSEAKGIFTNGEFWLIGGSGNNTMAHSYDGINWIGMSNSVFSVRCNAISWNGNIWVAGGEGTINMAYSKDGINWTQNNLASMTNILGIAWNGNRFIACGSGINTLAYSDNGINWTYVTNSTTIFDTQAEKVAWIFGKWVAVGRSNNTMAYSNDNGITWFVQGNSIFTTSGYDLAYNGQIGVAVGTGINTSAYSYNGIDWILMGKNTPIHIGYSVKWTGKMFIIGGNSNNEINKSRILVSYDGMNWFRQTTPHTINCFNIATVNDIEYGPRESLQSKQINNIKKIDFVSDSYNNSCASIHVKSESHPTY